MGFWKRLFEVPPRQLTEMQIIRGFAATMFYAWSRQEGNFSWPQKVFRAQLIRCVGGQSVDELKEEQFDRLLAALRRVAKDYPAFMQLEETITYEGDLGSIIGRVHLNAFPHGEDGFADLVVAHYQKLSGADRPTS